MYRYLLIFMIPSLICSCSRYRQLNMIREQHMSAEVAQLLDNKVAELGYDDLSVSDTVELTGMDGEEIIIMNAEKDRATGEIVLKDVLQPASIRARIRNVPERNGRIDIAFEIIAPKSLLNSRWQTRFFPKFVLQEDTLTLEPVYLTGKEYRERQLRGYELYERFLARIIDPDDKEYFMHRRLLEIFIERNIPEISDLKRDTSFIDLDSAQGKFGISYREAEEYYRNRFRIHLNDRRISDREERFRKYVAAPFEDGKLRLDTIVVNGESIIYQYVQPLKTRPHLRKVELFMDGNILQDGKEIYRIPAVGPLTFYVSSISGLMEDRTRYLKKILFRNLDVTTSANIDFNVGSHKIEEELNNNYFELRRIRKDLSKLLEMDDVEIDSIQVFSTCSPEGSFRFNSTLAERRGRSITRYLSAFVNRKKDSLDGMMHLGDSGWIPERRKLDSIHFIRISLPEDWHHLESLVQTDSCIMEKEKILQIIRSENDPDSKETQLKKMKEYAFIKDRLYPRLRIVDFTFFLHRKNMIRDTVHTTVIDTLYMNGLEALKNRDYKAALRLLQSYRDYNTAVSLMCLDFTDAAIGILKDLSPTAHSEYLLAVAYSRKGDMKKAVGKFIDAVRKDRKMLYRGNLDPEISRLIDRYRLTVKKIENGTI